MLDQFGVDYLELTNPCSSPQSRADLETICKLGLKVCVQELAIDAKSTDNMAGQDPDAYQVHDWCK